MTTDSSTAPAESGFKNRRLGLIVFGILQILLGVGCARLLTLTALSPMLSGAGAAAAQPGAQRTLLLNSLIYAAPSVWLIWMGIGSIMGRRWARALILVSCWVWLVGGAAGLAGLFWNWSSLADLLARQSRVPPDRVAVIDVTMLATWLLFGVLLPALLVSFYQRKDVRATVERRDPQPRWTDRCPLPVLAGSVTSVMVAGCVLLTGFSEPALRVFGRVLTGAAATALPLAGAALLIYLAWACYRLRPHGWWGLWWLSSVWGASELISVERIGAREFYESLELSDAQRSLVQALSPDIDLQMVVWTGVELVVALGYLVWVRRFFRRA